MEQKISKEIRNMTEKYLQFLLKNTSYDAPSECFCAEVLTLTATVTQDTCKICSKNHGEEKNLPITSYFHCLCNKSIHFPLTKSHPHMIVLCYLLYYTKLLELFQIPSIDKVVKWAGKLW